MTLSPREREVVILLGDDGDRTYGDVARIMGIAISTVRTHVRSVLLKFPSPKRPRAALRDICRVLKAADGVFAEVVSAD